MANPSPARVKSSAIPAPSVFTATQSKHLAKSLRLPPQQTCVVALILQAMRDKQIAVEMGLGISTVRDHLCSIYDRLGVADRMELVLHIFSLHFGEMVMDLTPQD